MITIMQSPTTFLAATPASVKTLLKTSGFTIGGGIMALALFVIMSKLAESEPSYIESKPSFTVNVNNVKMLNSH